MLIMAACTNRFAATVYSHTTVGVMLYGIMMEIMESPDGLVWWQHCQRFW